MCSLSGAVRDAGSYGGGNRRMYWRRDTQVPPYKWWGSASVMGNKKTGCFPQKAAGRRYVNYRAFLATSTREAKAAASVMASSLRALRFISTPAFFRPYMKRE